MELRNNAFYMGGIKVTDLVKKYDSPLYLYDLEVIKNQYQRITSAFSKSKVKINFACKALTNVNILKYFNEIGAGLDAVSIQEVWLGLKAGFQPKDIMYTPNCVSMEEIDLAVQEGVKINIDNISILEQFGHKYGNSIPVGIRINPHIMGG